VILSDDEQTVNTTNIQFGSFDEVQVIKTTLNSNMDKGKAPMVLDNSYPEKDLPTDILLTSNFRRSPHPKVISYMILFFSKTIKIYLPNFCLKLSFTPPTNISFKIQKKMSPSDLGTAKSCISSLGSTSTMITKTQLPPKPFRAHKFKSTGATLPKVMLNKIIINLLYLIYMDF